MDQDNNVQANNVTGVQTDGQSLDYSFDFSNQVVNEQPLMPGVTVSPEVQGIEAVAQPVAPIPTVDDQNNISEGVNNSSNINGVESATQLTEVVQPTASMEVQPTSPVLNESSMLSDVSQSSQPLTQAPEQVIEQPVVQDTTQEVGIKQEVQPEVLNLNNTDVVSSATQPVEVAQSTAQVTEQIAPTTVQPAEVAQPTVQVAEQVVPTTVQPVEVAQPTVQATEQVAPTNAQPAEVAQSTAQAIGQEVPTSAQPAEATQPTAQVAEQVSPLNNGQNAPGQVTGEQVASNDVNSVDEKKEKNKTIRFGILIGLIIVLMIIALPFIFKFFNG